MDVDLGYKYIDRFRGGVQWYWMESKDNISSLCFKLKNENNNSYHSTVKVFLLDYLTKKFDSYNCLEH